MSPPDQPPGPGAAPARKRLAARDTASRVPRLALKELRETLRDRRTIITLVLMPLLVYPVMSLAFKQFLLTSFQQQSEVRLRIAAPTQEELVSLSLMMQQGDKLLRENEASQSPRIDSKAEADKSATRVPLSGFDLGAEPSLEQIDAVVQPELEHFVQEFAVDLGVRIAPRRGADGEEQKTVDVQLIYRPNTPTSRQAALFVERRLRAINENFVTSRLREVGQPGELPAAWEFRPLADEEGESFWLASLVPLVLILMTITGAVYPAIDLTAGERERGTLEALMAAPVPRLSLLFAKYIAVLTVALLTAVVNLIGMSITVVSTGLGPVLFGERGLSLGAVAVVFCLLVLFAAFFSAVLLCVTSFARSFKEAQAYLIPLMLVALAPGFLSVIPGLQLNAWLAVAPLANIVLLARDVLTGNVDRLWGFVAVLTTALYGAAALALAARIFGSDAILYGSQGGWGDLFRRPKQLRDQATPAGALACLAIVTPLFILTTGLYSQMRGFPLPVQLLTSAGLTLLLFLATPLFMARLQGVSLSRGFQLSKPRLLALLGALMLGISLWPLAYELIIWSLDWGFSTITDKQLAEYVTTVEAQLNQWRQLSPAAVLLVLGLVPAIGEELFFRGYLLGSLRGRLPAWLAIVATGLLFGLFHASTAGLIVMERVLSSTALGLVLGWVCWQSGSVIPGILLHALNNMLLLSLAYWSKNLQSLGFDLENERHLPPAWIAGAIALSALGIGLVYLGRRRKHVAVEATEPRAT